MSLMELLEEMKSTIEKIEKEIEENGAPKAAESGETKGSTKAKSKDKKDELSKEEQSENTKVKSGSKVKDKGNAEGLEADSASQPDGKSAKENAAIRETGSALPTADESCDEEDEDFRDDEDDEEDFDPFAASHSPLTTRFHYALSSFGYHSAPLLSIRTPSKDFFKRSECVAARDKALKSTYSEACDYLNPKSSKCIANETAKLYAEGIDRGFICVFEPLNDIAAALGKKEAADRLYAMVNDAEKNLRAEFADILSDSYYEMYSYDYFLERTEIEEFNWNGDENGFWNLVAKVGGTMEYMIRGLDDSLFEIRSDFESRADSFYNGAFSYYERYVGRMENPIELLGEGLDKFKENESIPDYLIRMREKVCESKNR